MPSRLATCRWLNAHGSLAIKIGLIGVGKLGGTLARQLVDVGHDVAISNSRGAATLTRLVAELGGTTRATTAEDAANFGDLIVVSVPFGRYRELPTGGLAGKIVIDTQNYYPHRDGHFEELDIGSTTSSELLRLHLSDARIVKALNTIYWQSLRVLRRPTGDPGRIGIPISGDDSDAKAKVADLVDQIGFDAVDAGTLADGGRKHQPGTPVYAVNLTTRELRARLAAY
jgi:predicted dinucleotide-binding enzyme